VWAVLVSSLSARDDGAGGGDLVVDTTVVDLVDHFAVIDDPRHPSWVVHPLAAVLVLCCAAVVAGMRGFTAIAGWVTDTPPALRAGVYTRCGKPPTVPSKGTIWQVVTHVDAAAVDAAVGLWLAERADIDIAVDAPEDGHGGDEQPGPVQPTDPERVAAPCDRQEQETMVGPPRVVLAVDGNGSAAPRTPTATPRTCSLPPLTSRAWSSLRSTCITKRTRSRCSPGCWTRSTSEGC
jgi:hypothetical protein